ncbi:restriction endonuclease subunit S [uncultured Catenibacterium sp.]|uniref:restriction endonuclease subunit S n=1 Tax=uncultured Catenibacterium sp. TaxID=286142 RepID=UPI0025968E26|nr:restriction endonuclease subunit S [uncultured Catenibacterium sp.]
MSRWKLEEFISYEQPSKYIVNSDQYDDSFEIPVLTAGKSFILGYTDETNNIFDNLPVIIFDDFTTSVQFVDFPFKVKSSAMKLLKNTEQADIKYCYYLLKYLQHTPENHKRQWLSTTSQKTVELPVIEEQKNIVSKLDKILEVIDNQNKQLELLDEAIKARFVEMFGTIYDKKFDMKTLPDIVSSDKNSIKRGPFGGALKKEDFLEDGYMVYEQRHAIHEDFEYAKYYVSPEKYESMIGFKVVPGDLIISCSGTLGRIAEVPMGAKEGIINQALLKISLNKDIMNNQFFIYQFRCKEIQDMLFGISRGSGIANMPSMNEVKAFKFICPPLELQNQFASFVEEIDKSRLLSNHSLFLIKSIIF